MSAAHGVNGKKICWVGGWLRENLPQPPFVVGVQICKLYLSDNGCRMCCCFFFLSLCCAILLPFCICAQKRSSQVFCFSTHPPGINNTLFYFETSFPCGLPLLYAQAIQEEHPPTIPRRELCHPARAREPADKNQSVLTTFIYLLHFID